MPITIGAKRESDFTDPIGMLGDCHRRIEMFLNVLVRVAEQDRGGVLNEEHRGALETALRYFREGAPKHTADEEESLFPRLRRIESADVRALLARVESLEEEHVCADRSHAEVDRLGMLWLRDGTLADEQAATAVDASAPTARPVSPSHRDRGQRNLPGSRGRALCRRPRGDRRRNGVAALYRALARDARQYSGRSRLVSSRISRTAFRSAGVSRP